MILKKSPKHHIVSHPHSRLSKYLGLGLSMPLLCFLVFPVLAVAIKAPPAILMHYLGDSATMQAIGLSVGTSLAATFLVILLGTPIARVLAKWQFPGKHVLEVLVDLPTVLPPAVAGLALLVAFGRQGLLGNWLNVFNIQIAFTPIAVVLAQTFVSAPYYIKSAAIGFSSVTEDLEQAAAVDGANHVQVFRHISVPLAWRSIVGGAVLSWARALGEFGATIIFAGNFPGRTQTMPLAVYMGFEIDINMAIALAAIMLITSFGILLLVRTLLHTTDAGRFS